MQNPITFMPTEPSGNSAKQIKSNAVQQNSASFKQLLSKEISAKKPAAQENSVDKADNKTENKTVDTSADVKPNAPVEAGKERLKTDDNSEDKSETDQNLSENQQVNGGQLIALVESLAQFSAKTVSPSTETTDVNVPLIDGSTSATTIAANAADIAMLTSDQKNDPTLVSQAQYVNSSGKDIENTLATLTGKTFDKLVNAPVTSLPAPINDLSLTNPEGKQDVMQQMLETLSSDLKTDSKVEIKTEAKADSKYDAKIDLKADPKTEAKPEVKYDIKPEAKPDLKTDLKIQASTSAGEPGAKISEISPSAQNFAQQIAVSSGQINASIEVEHLAPRVGTSAWDQAVGQKVIWMVAGGKQTAELTLNPPDLGPMQVVLSISNEQANATFISAQPDVREALESAMPKLREMMNDAGIQLSGFSVKSESSNQGNQFANERSFPRSKNNTNDAANELGSASTITPGASRSSAGLGIVDTFA